MGKPITPAVKSAAAGRICTWTLAEFSALNHRSSIYRRSCWLHADPDLFSHLYLEKTFPGLFDNSKIRSVMPDFTCDISLHDGIKMMVDWFEQEANQVDPEKDALEDRLVELSGWKDQMEALFGRPT